MTAPTSTPTAPSSAASTPVDASTAAAQAIIEQAQRLGLVWRIIPGSVVGDTTNINNIAVTLDSDTKQTRAQSLIGAVQNADRVMVLLVPPNGAFIIGYFGQSPLPNTIRDYVASTSNSGAIGAETVVLIGGSMTFVSGRAYKVKWGQRLDHSVAQTAIVRVRQTNISGTQLIFWQQQVAAAAGNHYFFEATIRRTAASDLIDNLVMTLATATGTVTARGAADTVRYMEVWDCGLASRFPQAIAI